ncbi:DUF6415 family natural product biosynthesis protein [Streptomyces sp. NPDC001407]|uniref:DUF6415 family natural product biosynthesis protein n=1 Tax=Streptomyces sp. NPDC001407 TaxID=3364573 RepID=UPI0036C8D610
MRTFEITNRRSHDPRSTAQTKAHEYPIDVDGIMGTIRATLDRMPLANTVEHLLLRLRGHIQLLLAEIEAKGWARYGQDNPIRLLATAARDKLNDEPKAEPVIARCLYAQELARVCRELLALTLAGPGLEQHHLAVAS